LENGTKKGKQLKPTWKSELREKERYEMFVGIKKKINKKQNKNNNKK
jgi:hypothetical protein